MDSTAVSDETDSTALKFVTTNATIATNNKLKNHIGNLMLNFYYLS